MEMLLGCLETHPHARTISARDHRELQPRDISAPQVLREPREFIDEGMEFIEMRYQQAMALANLEDLFAEGQLDGM